MWPKRSKPKVQAAKDALADAETHLREIESRQDEVQGVVEGFLRLSRENNFAGSLRQIMMVPEKRKHA